MEIKNKIIFISLEGVVREEFDLNLESICRCDGMKIKCLMKDKTEEVGYLSGDRDFGSDSKEKDNISLYTLKEYQEEKPLDCYELEYRDIPFQDIENVIAVLYSSPRWGVIPSNDFKYDTDSIFDEVVKLHSYTYVYVEYEDKEESEIDKLYCYLANNLEIKKGDRVLVERGISNVGARVINVVSYKKEDVPVPLEIMKDVIKVIDEDFIIDEDFDYENFIEEEELDEDDEEVVQVFPSYQKIMRFSSIYSAVSENITKNGMLSKRFCLDEYKTDEEKKITFALGCLDNTILSTKNEDFLIYFEKMLCFLNDDNFLFYTRCLNIYLFEHPEVRMIGNIDAINQHICASEEEIDNRALYEFSLCLLLDSKNIEAVKLGIGLLYLFVIDKDEKIIKRLEMFALCEEFTLFANYVFSRLEESNQIRFRLAKKLSSWGKICLVKDLKVTDRNIKDWLITNGVDNDIEFSYLAFAITEKVDIIEVLNQKDISKDEIVGISKIIVGLLDEDTNLGISQFIRKNELFESYFKWKNRYYEDIYYINGLVSIYHYMLSHRENRKLIFLIKCFFKSSSFLTGLKKKLNSDTRESNVLFNQVCEILYSLKCNKLNDTIYETLKLGNPAFYGGVLVLLADSRYYNKVIKILEEYDFSKLYGSVTSGMDFSLNSSSLVQIIQIVSDYPFSCEKVVIAGLKCSSMLPRNASLNTIIKWLALSEKKFKNLSKELQEELTILHDKECMKSYREKINKIMELDEDLSDFVETSEPYIMNCVDELFDLFQGDLDTIFEPMIASRGRNYYEEHMVYNCVKTVDKYTMYVQGSNFGTEYLVSIYYEDDKIIKMFCSCPYDKNCKHEYASILYIREQENRNDK